MQIVLYPDRNEWPELLKRPANDTSQIERPVSRILKAVKSKGDTAVRKYTAEFDHVRLRKLEVSAKEIRQAKSVLDPQLKKAILQAADNIRKFHSLQIQGGEEVETMPGIICRRKAVAIENVGLYIPGGSAPLFSTILMLGIPAVIAGCKNIILCSPPSADGSLHPAIIFAADAVGIKKIFKAGGVQAIGAMAYGTASIPKMDKIFGPGNQYVTLAKQMVQQDGVAIDMPAGPSEVCVLADASAEPAFIAADLLSQAEHGADSQVLLVTTSESLVHNVLKKLNEQLSKLPRQTIAEKALKNSSAIVLNNMDEAMVLVNAYAPEHLIISCVDHNKLAEQVVNAGSVFLGNYSPESVGDYASGTNHTLPTHGYARAYSGVSVDSFVKKITFQELTRAGLELISQTVITMAEHEGLQAHAEAVRQRLK
ncbi:MAG TPA: histidinol dehydrogenase [Chitinophagaceae bacterium]|nr:histidinol dehydrogenase [Chitinophagaceae bacterium]